MSTVHNVIIIGSGPAGYTAGLYAARAMLEPLMFAGYMSGGQLMLTSDIENFPGYPKGIGGPEMMMELREQAERFGLEVRDQNVEKVQNISMTTNFLTYFGGVSEGVRGCLGGIL